MSEQVIENPKLADMKAQAKVEADQLLFEDCFQIVDGIKANPPVRENNDGKEAENGKELGKVKFPVKEGENGFEKEHFKIKFDWEHHDKLVRRLEGAIDDGSARQLQRVIQELGQTDERMARRVLETLKTSEEKNNPLRHVSYIVGSDEHGRTYVRLNLSQANDHSKSAGHTTATFDSNGQRSATTQDRWDSVRKPINPAEALDIMSSTNANWPARKQLRP